MFVLSKHHSSLWITVLLCGLIYTFGVFGGFLFDDFPNIVNNPGIRVTDGSVFQWLVAALSSHAGMLRRPVSMLSFAANYYFFGLSPLAFKLINLLIHLLNGLLLYSLARRLVPYLTGPDDRDNGRQLPSSMLAVFVTAAWMLHPLNVSTVLYIVQRMDLLAAMFTLAGLICFVEGRMRTLRGEKGLLVAFSGIVVFGLLATLSKENGALITAYAFVIEAVCFRFNAHVKTQTRAVQIFFLLTLALPIIVVIVSLMIHPGWLLGGYAGRDFTLTERLLTEGRILCSYLEWIVIPWPHWMGIYHDNIVISTGILHPVTTLPAIAFLSLLVIIAWRIRTTQPGITFGIAWFLAGQSMESTILPLELAFDHRNYLPMAGLILGTISALGPWLGRQFSSRMLITVCAIVVLALSGTTALWAYTWGDPLRLAMSEVAKNPNSPRAQYEAGRQIIFNGTASGHRDEAEQRATPYFERGKELDPTDLYAASSLILIHGRNSRQIDSAELSDLARRVQSTKRAQIDPFLVTMTAAASNAIRIKPEQMKMLVTAALGNTYFPNTHRAMIMNDYGQYLFNVVHEPQDAVSMTLAATMEDPKNPLFEVNVAKLAIALSSPDIAKTHLHIATTLDITGEYAPTINELRKRLDLTK